jgi:glycosyltransferase involved in cell wall biosynthesis
VTALATAAQPTGLAVYARMTSDRLAALAPDDVRVVSRESRQGNGLVLALARLRWLYLGLDAEARVAGADAILHLLPEVGRTRRPQVVVLHDLVPLVAETTRRQRLYSRTVVRHAVRSAAGVIADSQQTKSDAVRIFGVPPEHVVVVHPGVDLDRYRPSTDGNRPVAPFILAVGSHAPHKRLGLLMRGFAGSSVASTHELHIVGPASRFTAALVALRGALGIEKRVRLLPYDSPEELARRYACADLYASASSYEGFGLPALEALASGLPVVVTDVGAARAYVGEAGIVLPRDVDVARIAAALENGIGLSADPETRALARRQAEGFSWDRTAVGLLEAVRNFTGLD